MPATSPCASMICFSASIAGVLARVGAQRTTNTTFSTSATGQHVGRHQRGAVSRR
jgi:hypothetical protein